MRNKLNIRPAALIGLILICPLLVSAQDSLLVSTQDTLAVQSDNLCPDKDFSDVIRGALHKPLKVKTDKVGALMLLPIIGSNPAIRFMFGVGGNSLGTTSPREAFLTISSILQDLRPLPVHYHKP